MSTRIGARHRIRLGVGLLWMIAGGLQLQSFMFTRQFADDVLGSASLSQPSPLGALITWTQHLVGDHPVLFNWPFAIVQLAIGLGMVFGGRGRIARLACAGSVAWAGAVWLVGEGAGGLLTGLFAHQPAALSTGAPGAALVYGLLTLAAWPRPGAIEPPLARGLVSASWLGVWALGAVLATLPAQWGASGLGAQAAMGWMMEPSWAVRPADAVMTWLLGLPVAAAVAVSIGVLAVNLIIASAVLLGGRAARTLTIIGIVVALGYWIFAQGFGGLTTGTATDVGTAPMIILLGLAVLWREPKPVGRRTNDHEEIRIDSDHRSGRDDPRQLQLVGQDLLVDSGRERAGRVVDSRRGRVDPGHQPVG